MTEEFVELFEDVLLQSMITSSAGFAMTVFVYVFYALGLYTIAKRRQTGKAWLAWIPVGNVWLLGSISDQYQYVVKGQVKNKRIILLLGYAFVWVLGAVCLVKIVMALRSVFLSINAYGSPNLDFLMKSAVPVAVSGLGMMAAAIVVMVFEYMALYDLYRSCDPDNSVVYLVLSIIPGISYIAMPLFLFLCRNQDKGMPPRKHEEPAITEHREEYNTEP